MPPTRNVPRAVRARPIAVMNQGLGGNRILHDIRGDSGLRRFGSRVTVIEYGDRLIAREDREVSREVQAILEREVQRLVDCGVRIETNKVIGKTAKVAMVPDHQLKWSELE